VSHTGADTWVAKQVARGIAHCGASAFLDDAQIQTGADFEEEILAFLNRAHELVVLLTPWAMDRPYVWAELGAAWARRIPIVVLLHGLNAAELQSKPGAPVFLKAKNCRDLNDVARYFAELRSRVRSRRAR
jgi:hypothetical protein